MEFGAGEWLILGACVLAFLLGSIPFGLLIARMFNVKDLRSQGSGNIGATNVARVVGFWPAGFLTLFLDALKGVVAVLLVEPFASKIWLEWLRQGTFEFSTAWIWTVGLCSLLGHCYSPWLQFKGGKGVATGLGVFAMLSPLAALGGVVAFVITFLNHRIGSLSSLAGLMVLSVVQVVVYPAGVYLLPGAVMIFVVIMRHEKNIDALLENRESKF